MTTHIQQISKHIPWKVFNSHFICILPRLFAQVKLNLRFFEGGKCSCFIDKFYLWL